MAEEFSPRMEDMFAFRPMTRVRQAMTQEEAIEVLANEKRGVLSLLGDGGYPYGVPLNHWYNPDDGKLYFHGGKHGHRIDAMRDCSKASFCVLDSGVPDESGMFLDFRSVIVFGRLEFVEDQETALEISRKISRKFTADEGYIEREVRESGSGVLCFALVPEHISGKRVHER